MAKRKKTLLLGGIALVVLIGIMVTVLVLFAGGNDDSTDSSSGGTFEIVNENINNIAEIKVENDLGGFIITQEVEGTFDVPALEDFAVDQDNTKAAFSRVAVISANTLVAENPDDLSQYGFDDPQAVVEVTLKSGGSYTVTIADAAPTGLGDYVQISGDDNVYIVSNAYMSQYYKKIPKDFVALTLHDYGSETIYASGFQLYLRDYADPLTFVYMPNDTSPDKPSLSDVYQMVEPVRCYLSAENFDTFTQPIASVYAQSVVTIHPTEADLDEYGFDDPEAVYIATLDDGTFTLTVGDVAFEDNGDGTATQIGYYAIHSGVDAIFILSVEELAWVQIDISTAIAKVSYAPVLKELNNVTIEANGKKYVNKVTVTGEEATDWEVAIDGLDIDHDRYATFYEYLISARAEALYLGAAMEGNPVVKMTFQYADTSNNDLVVELYDIGDRKAVICINGQPKFTTRLSYLNNLVNNLDLIANNENIVTSY